MAQTITPVVHGGRAGWMRSVAAHTFGAVVSAGALGAALGAAGMALGAPWGRTGFVLVTLVGIVYSAREVLGAPVALPNLRRQVPEWWRTFFSPLASSFLYGAGLGVGFLTYLSFGTLVAAAAVAVASGRPLTGVAILAPFGLARGLSVLVAAPATSAGRSQLVVDRLDSLALSRIPRLVNGVALLGVSAIASAGVIRGGRFPGAGAGAAILAAVFATAAASKLAGPSGWRRTLTSYRLGRLSGAALAGVPLAELAVAALVVGGRARVAGILALALLAAFSLAIVRAARLNGGRLACGCFGRAATRGPRVLLARNLMLALLAGLVAAAPGPVSLAGVTAPTGADALPAALALAGGVVVFLLLRAALTLSRSSHRN